MTRPIVLVFHSYYLPGFKSGGPVRTLANMVEHLGDEIDFRIITSDRDIGDAVPYPGVEVDHWNTVGKAQVYYASSAGRSLRNLGRLIRNTEHDILYFNSFFDPAFSLRPLLLRRLHLIPPKPTILSPRGEFSPKALQLKSLKKRLFINVAKVVQLYKDITWHASSEMEEGHVKQRGPSFSVKRSKSQIKIARNLSPKYLPVQNEDVSLAKQPGSLRLVFLGRIAPMKNLDFALKVLKGVCGNILFDIYGPIDRDKGYWKTCKQLIFEMPDNISIDYKGPVDHEKVRDTFAQYHAFLLPTRGENFGHVIVESLFAGCPVVLSDRTPWNDLEEKQSGWNIPLEQPEKFQTVLQELVAMEEDQWNIHVQCAKRHAMQTVSDQDVLEQNRQLFLRVIPEVGS